MNGPAPAPTMDQYIGQQCYLALEAMRLGYAQDSYTVSQILTQNILDRVALEHSITPQTKARHAVQKGAYTK